MIMSLSERIVLVTGGSRGIGRVICRRLAGMGAKVYVNYVSGAAAADETVAMIEAAGGKAVSIAFNVADPVAVKGAISGIAKDEGRLDILVNNAGITRDGLMMKMSDEAWDAVLDTNLKGDFTCIREAMRPMMKGRWGRIINIGSVIGSLGNVGQVNYAAAKAGLAGLTRSVAREMASRGVTVNGVAPGYIDTDMTSGLSDEIKEAILAQIPMAKMGSADDVASAVAWLASPEAGYVTGQFIHVNGGMFMA